MDSSWLGLTNRSKTSFFVGEFLFFVAAPFFYYTSFHFKADAIFQHLWRHSVSLSFSAHLFTWPKFLNLALFAVSCLSRPKVSEGSSVMAGPLLLQLVSEPHMLPRIPSSVPVLLSVSEKLPWQGEFAPISQSQFKKRHVGTHVSSRTTSRVIGLSTFGTGSAFLSRFLQHHSGLKFHPSNLLGIRTLRIKAGG